MAKIKSSEITPEHIYLNRRQFMIAAGALTASLLLPGCSTPEATSTPALSGTADPAVGSGLESELTSYEEIINYNNYYEFSVDKRLVAGLAEGFVTSPWDVHVGGLVNNPKTFSLEELLKFDQEERIYRLRCVEAWSMVIPWYGFPLHKLLAIVEPTSEAQYVRFETVLDEEQMPGLRSGGLDWPYVEALHIDEAMHDLAFLATGLYGKDMPPQSGAPIRLVVPWKYGFKSGKSIVKIDLVAERPETTWAIANPREYGFYANVNPNVNHPRWSQASERRIGGSDPGRRETLMFNGYEAEVASLYEGLNLERNF